MFAAEPRHAEPRHAEPGNAPLPGLPPQRRPLPPWTPSPEGDYRLPRDILARLVAALTALRNREAALELAVFLARHWLAPSRLVVAFPVDRRALSDRSTVGLTEARVRGALASLEAVGFLDRAEVPSGSRYRATEHGLQRKPVLWRFGAAYRDAFAAANRRALAKAAAMGRRPIRATPPPPRSPSLLLAQKQNLVGEAVLMGEQTRQRPRESENPGLEAALDRLRRAIGGG